MIPYFGLIEQYLNLTLAYCFCSHNVVYTPITHLSKSTNVKLLALQKVKFPMTKFFLP